jgi:Uma2 family endonuclease
MAVRRGVQFLATDIWDTPDDGKRYEVIDGELYVTPLPPPQASECSGPVARLHRRTHLR